MLGITWSNDDSSTGIVGVEVGTTTLKNCPALSGKAEVCMLYYLAIPFLLVCT